VGTKDLPLDSGRRIASVFVDKFGWQPHRGKNHIVLTHPHKPPSLVLSIPDHKHVDRFLLKAELRKAGLTVDEFCAAYHGR
jgi:hypothetical protein